MSISISQSIEQMSQTTENNECNELDKNPFEWNIGATNKVKQLKRDRKISNCNQEITHFLALNNVMYAPHTFFITITIGDSVSLALTKIMTKEINNPRNNHLNIINILTLKRLLSNH